MKANQLDVLNATVKLNSVNIAWQKKISHACRFDNVDNVAQ